MLTHEGFRVGEGFAEARSGRTQPCLNLLGLAATHADKLAQIVDRISLASHAEAQEVRRSQSDKAAQKLRPALRRFVQAGAGDPQQQAKLEDLRDGLTTSE